MNYDVSFTDFRNQLFHLTGRRSLVYIRKNLKSDPQTVKSSECCKDDSTCLYTQVYVKVLIVTGQNGIQQSKKGPLHNRKEKLEQ